MVRFQVISDLHLPHRRDWTFSQLVQPQPDVDVLLVAGDIGNPESPDYSRFLDECSAAFPLTLVILGNHEAYGHSLLRARQLAEQAANDLTNVRILECKTHDLEGTGIRIAGCCLWSSVPPPARHVLAACISDYRAIFSSSNERRLASTEELNQVHEQSVSWLEGEIARANEDGVKLVVMTHHLPSFDLVQDKYKETKAARLLNHAFASHLDRLICKPVALWVCGHTHTATRKLLGNDSVPVCVNPLGYPRETDTGYSPALVEEVRGATQ